MAVPRHRSARSGLVDSRRRILRGNLLHNRYMRKLLLETERKLGA